MNRRRLGLTALLAPLGTTRTPHPSVSLAWAEMPFHAVIRCGYRVETKAAEAGLSAIRESAWYQAAVRSRIDAQLTALTK